MSTTQPSSTDPVPGVLRTAWANLPVLLAGSVPVAAAWVGVRALPAGAGWLALLGVGLVVLPLLAALVHVGVALLDGDDVGVRDLVATLRRACPAAVRVTVVPTVAAVLTLLALQVWAASHQAWVLASVGAGLAVTVVTALVGVVALPYGVGVGTAGRPTWLVSAYVATRNPVPVLGVVSALGLGVWAAAHLAFALVLLLPAPLALVWASGHLAATRRSRAVLEGRTIDPS